MILTNSYNSDYEFPKKLFIHWYKYSGLDEYLCWFRRVLVIQIVIYRLSRYCLHGIFGGQKTKRRKQEVVYMVEMLFQFAG